MFSETLTTEQRGLKKVIKALKSVQVAVSSKSAWLFFGSVQYIC